MKVVVLIDNKPHPEMNLLSEHGLSIYFEADGLKWLFDVGASNNFFVNAEHLGINISDIDYLVLSHGHSDHTGGLGKFLEVNSRAQIIMSANIRGENFYSHRFEEKRNIGIDHSVIEKSSNRFIFADNNMMISKNAGVVLRFPRKFDTPKSNKNLTLENSDGETPDEFQHEVALCVNSPNGFIVFSGCSHNGILNILETCTNFFHHSRVLACIGGTHLRDSDSLNTYESATEIKNTGRAILHNYPGMQLITGHCTGDKAKKLLSQVMGDKFQAFHTGAAFNIMESNQKVL